MLFLFKIILDVKVPFTKLKRRRCWIDSKQKGNGKHINHRKPRTIKGRRKHKMERKGIVKMWEACHYKARLEAMATLKMSGCHYKKNVIYLQICTDRFKSVCKVDITYGCYLWICKIELHTENFVYNIKKYLIC